jgi:hypothetical protein
MTAPPGSQSGPEVLILAENRCDFTGCGMRIVDSFVESCHVLLTELVGARYL